MIDKLCNFINKEHKVNSFMNIKTLLGVNNDVKEQCVNL